jgi:hypothetical protein
MSGTIRLLASICFVISAGSVALLLIAIQPGRAGMPSSLPARLEMIWSTPITTEMNSDGTFGRSQGLVLDAANVAHDGTVVFLGGIIGGPHPGRVLLRDAERAGPDAVVHLELPAPDAPGPQFTGTWFFKKQRPNRNPAVLSFALDAKGQTWLGGFSNDYMGIASDSHRDAYLAKLNGNGKLVWERNYGKGGWLALESIVPTTDGGVVGVGRDMHASWLAKIAEDGTLLKEYGFGNGKGAAVARLNGDRFLIVGFNGEGQAASYEDNVSAWVLDDAGALRGPTRIREALNQTSGSSFGYVATAEVTDGAYVASNWSDMFRPQAVEVARLGPQGTLLWRQRLPDTVSDPKPTQVATYDTCKPALATLAGGDALVACALHGEIQLYRFKRDTGAVKTARLPLPECQRSHPATLFLMAPRDGTVLLGGSRPGNNVAENCSWLGRLVMQAE